MPRYVDDVSNSAYRLLFAVLICAFGPALVTHLARLRFFSCGFVIRFGPMAAIGTEVPGIFVVSTSIGSCHVFVALLEVARA